MSFIDTARNFATRRQLLAAGAAVAVLTALLAAVWLTWFHSGYRVLFKDLRPVDAAAIVADLDKRKTPYRLEDGGATILVPAKLADATRLAVSTQDLPLKGVVGFELFNKSDMGLTEFAQRINYRRALEGELARTIMSLDAIDQARVHLALAEPVIFREERRASRASVTLIPRPGRTLTPETVEGVRRLVAAATTDLDVSDVVVLDQHGVVVSGPGFAETPASPPSVGERQAIEAYYAARIRRSLQRIYPEDQLRVLVTAEPGAAPEAFAAWTPGARRFALTMVVRLAAPVGPEVRDEIQAAAAEAVDADPQAGDTLTVAFDQAAPAEPAPRAPSPAPSSSSSLAPGGLDWASPRISVLAALGVLGVLLALAATRLQSLRPGGRALSAAQREAYASRLRDLLSQEEPDGAERT